MPVTELSFTLSSVFSETPLRVCFSALDVGRAIYLYIGLGDAPPSLGSLYAAVPGSAAAAAAAAPVDSSSLSAGSGASATSAAAAAQPPLASFRPMPASSTQLLDGCAPTVDETEADFFSSQLSARTGKLVLLSFNASSDLVDLTGLVEIKRRALEFVEALRK